jgi:hypothetical protein
MVRVSALIGAVALASAATAAAVGSKVTATITATDCATPSPTVDLGYGLWSGKINVGDFFLHFEVLGYL